jgi:hypothetical protein
MSHELLDDAEHFSALFQNLTKDVTGGKIVPQDIEEVSGDLAVIHDVLVDFIKSGLNRSEFFGKIFTDGTYSCGTERRDGWGRDVRPGTLTHLCGNNSNFHETGEIAPFCQVSLYMADDGYEYLLLARDLSHEGRVLFQRDSDRDPWVKYRDSA